MTHPHPVNASGDALGASYRLRDPIGSGAVGEVWRVESLADGSILAAKILKAEHASDPGLVERFVRERSLLLALHHPNIVAVRDMVVEGSTLAIVMDYVPGGTLRDLLITRESLPPAAALSLAAQVFDALDAAHAQGVVHRDIKPDNVLLASEQNTSDPVARVSDFGIATVLEERDRKSTGVAGTPQYMPPELIANGEASRAGDVYATGVLLYELLAGRTPFAGEGNDFTTIYRHVTSAPPRLDLPDELWAFVESLLAKEPTHRPDAAAAAFIARRFARQFADLGVLPPTSPVVPRDTVAHGTLAHPPTMLRAAGPKRASDGPASEQTLPAPLPDLGPTDGQTIVRPLARVQPEPEPEATPQAEAPASRLPWLTRRVVVWLCIGVVLLTGIGVGGWWLIRHGAATTTSTTAALDARQQDPVLPTGLSVTREASYDPGTKTTLVTFTYQAQKSPLTGSFLEVIPSLPGTQICPPVTWKQAEATKHQASTTGLEASCGWKLTGVNIPANGEVTFTASFPGEFHESSEFDQWLDEAASATSGTLLDPRASSTAYPVQRLQDIYVKTPARTVSQTTLPVTLVPVWPGGADEMNPLYQSPSVGAPSQMLVDVAGGETGVRFSDSCAGAVAVSSDGLVVTALSVTPECRLHATVGNFTSLESSPFSITTR